MEAELNELHNLTVTTFQNVANLTPALRQMVANAKVYQKSIHTTCNLAVMFVESLQNVANAAKLSEGATKKLSDVLVDIIDAFKEIENMKLELTKVFINEIIIPLESKAEIQISNMKAAYKTYNQVNKTQSETVEKVRSNVLKTRRRSLRKKKSQKYEEKEKVMTKSLEDEEKKLKELRQNGLRDALIEERRVYCFVAERMCAYGRGMIVYNNRISNFVNQKIPDWTQYISKPTELPPDSENIITNPTGYKMGTVKRKITKNDKKDSVKRGKSFSHHYQTKYSTLDGRSRIGSRPSIATSVLSSRSNLTEPPSNRKPHLFVSTPPAKLKVEREAMTSSNSSPNSDVLPIYKPSLSDDSSSPPIRSEYANMAALEESAMRSHSYSGPRIDVTQHNSVPLNRTESAVCHMRSTDQPPAVDFRSRLVSIQNQLAQKFGPMDPDHTKNRLKALYSHIGHDASQLSFEKGDMIIPICEPTSGWQYGESEKTKLSGWFPAAYTEEVVITETSPSRTEVSPSNTEVSPYSARKHRPPPKVAKKTTRVSLKKSSVCGAPMVNGISDDVPGMRSSTSMPQIIHSVSAERGDTEEEQKRKISLEHPVPQLEEPFDDDDCANMPPPPPPPLLLVNGNDAENTSNDVNNNGNDV